MDPRAEKWSRQFTSQAADWTVSGLLKLKRDQRISVVIPARDEEATVGEVVGQIRERLMLARPLVDQLVVIDSLSSDATAQRARDAAATVWPVDKIRPELGVRAGKGEALWKSMFVTTGQIVVFIDADLTERGTHFVTGLVGPLLANSQVQLVKGFYDRKLDLGEGVAAEGGRVTELVARPWIAINRPELSGVVQPLAGEWAIRRSHLRSLSLPFGYGIELATLLDTHDRYGLEGIAQVDLGIRGHVHQAVHDLAVMATEIMVIAESATALTRRRRSSYRSHGETAPGETAEWSPESVRRQRRLLVEAGG